jgi:LysM repeat protein
MKKYLLILIVLFCSWSVVSQEYKTHAVKDGETISSIAEMYLITPFDIYALNPDAKTTLNSSTILIIPNTRVKNDPMPESVKEVSSFREHKVKRKQTLYSISKQFGIDV